MGGVWSLGAAVRPWSIDLGGGQPPSFTSRYFLTNIWKSSGLVQHAPRSCAMRRDYEQTDRRTLMGHEDTNRPHDAQDMVKMDSASASISITRNSKHGQSDKRRVGNDAPSFVMAASWCLRRSGWIRGSQSTTDQSTSSKRCTPVIGAAIWC